MDLNQRNLEAEREDLARTIAEWNANRLDLFELSAPNEDLEFHGVMRFFFQDAGSRVSTKCVRVSSTASTQDVVETLVEKFHPDMKMLSAPNFALYEVHVTGEERKLRGSERPLLVQLNWGKDDREGRFLLKKETDVTRLSYFENEDYMQNFKKKSPKKDKRDKRKKDKKADKKENEENIDDANASMSEKLYSAVPDSSFTRSISNPEAVMRRRRQLKLEQRLEQFSGKDGRPDSGGMLKVYGETLFPDVPYRTILVGEEDDAEYIVKETLVKYGRDNDNPAEYCLVKVVVPPGAIASEYVVTGGWGKETILDDDERPLPLIIRYPKSKGSLMFQLKRRPPGYQPRKKRPKNKKTKPGELDDSWGMVPQDRLPFLLELAPDGSEIRDYRPQVHRVQPNMTEIGSERSSSGQFLQLFAPTIHPRHCVITNMDGAVTVTPSNPDAETYINNQRVYETALLHDGVILRFGKMHTYRFCDPARRGREMAEAGVNYETTFDVDGHIETVSSPPPHLKEQKGRFDDILPATLEFKETGEDAFLAAIISEVNGAAVHFKLAPTYCLYLANRYRQSRLYRPEMSPTERAQRMMALTNKMAHMIERTVKENRDVAGALSFWMANASEFLHFLKQDVDLCPITLDAQDILAAAVQQAFRHLVLCMQQELEISMPAFLDPSDEADNTDHESVIDDDRSMDSHQSWRSRDQKMSGRWLSPAARTKYGGRPTLGDVLHTCSSTMTLLRRCRVNAALTIQLFSQLFHFVNMWLFNKLVLEPRRGLCTQEWGARLKFRLSAIESWAEKQGLELAADCHLSRIIQAAHLLQAPKSSEDDIASISSTCFKLNSLQLRKLLELYIPSGGHPRIPPQLIDSVVAVAQNTADELTRSDGREVKLQEDPDLQLPFLLPEDGYSCDIIRGVPNGLPDFLAPLESTGLCRLTIHASARGNWTVYFVGGSGDAGKSPVEGLSAVNAQQAPAQQQGIPYDTNIPPGEAEIYTVSFTKGNTGMGLSIVAAKGFNQERLGIYIKSVVKGGSAFHDGRLRDGDQLLEVNGNSLVGVTQERAAELMKQSGTHVTLVAAKQGAIYHGLATLLSQPSPTMQRAMPPRQLPRPKSEDILRSQNDNRWRTDPAASKRLPTHREAEDVNRARYPMQPTRDADKSKSSPNLLDDMSRGGNKMRGASTSDLYERYKKDPYYTLPRDKARHASASDLIDQPPRQEVRPAMPPESDTAMRSKSTSNLDPVSYDRMDPVRHTQSTMNVKGYPSPYQRDDRQPSTPMGPKTSTPEIMMYSQSPRPGQPPQQRFGLRPTAAYSDQQSPLPQSPSGYPVRAQEPPPPRVETYRPPGRQQTPQQRPYTPQREEPPQRYTPQREEPPQQRYTPQGVTPQQKAYTLPREDPQHRMYSPQREEVPPQPRTYTPQKEEPPQQQRAFTPQRDEPPPPQQQPVRVADLYAKPYRPPAQQPKHPVPSEPLPPPPPSTSYEDVPSDFPPPPPDLPPPPGDLGGPYAKQQQPLSASQQLLRNQPGTPTHSASSSLERGQKKRDLMEDQRRWHEEQKQRMKVESSVRLREKQRAAELQRGQYATLPANLSDNRNRHSEYMPQTADKPAQNPNRVSAYGDLPARQPPPVKEKPKPPPKPRTQSQSAPKITVSAAPTTEAPRSRYESSVDDLQYRADGQSPAVPQVKKEVSGGPTISPSPWTREQKEKESAAREEALKRRIDEEIQYLESIENRSPEQEEKLSNLKMEVEFQRRVEELKSKSQDDDDDADSDKDMKDTAMGRGRMLKMMQEDLESARQRIKSNDDQRTYYEEEQERDRLDRQEQRLQQLQQERESDKMRQAARQERQEREQEQWMQRQRELREQHRREMEESARLQQLEEERQKQAQLEELRKQREAEKAARRELELKREAEERLIRQREEEMRARHEQQKREQEERERELAEERRRLESQLQAERDANVYYAKPYQPYKEEDDVVHTTVNSYHVPGPEKTQIAPMPPVVSAPPPPERKSSYNTLERNTYGQRADVQQPGQPGQGTKKVSFHDTAQSYPAQDDYSNSAYRASTASSSSGGSTASPAYSQEFVSPNNTNNMATYTTAPTPGVIGAQEIYNDPRARIQAMQAAQKQKSAVPDRMSFRDKMKMFADEIGEGSPQEKPKTSKWERDFLALNTSLNGT